MGVWVHSAMHDEAGQSLVEYTMLIAFTVTVCVVAVTQLGVITANSPAWGLANVL